MNLSQEERERYVYICGIDPGVTGAFALGRLDKSRRAFKLLQVEDMPVVKAKPGRTGKAKQDVDLAQVPQRMSGFGIFQPNEVVIEQVGAAPGQGVASTFKFGYIAGALAGVATGLGIPVTTIRPQEWRKVVGVPNGTDVSLDRVRALFPEHAHMFKRKMDHNRAEAALICMARAYQLLPAGTGLLETRAA